MMITHRLNDLTQNGAIVILSTMMHRITSDSASENKDKFKVFDLMIQLAEKFSFISTRENKGEDPEIEKKVIEMAMLGIVPMGKYDSNTLRKSCANSIFLMLNASVGLFPPKKFHSLSKTLLYDEYDFFEASANWEMVTYLHSLQSKTAKATLQSSSPDLECENVNFYLQFTIEKANSTRNFEVLFEIVKSFGELLTTEQGKIQKEKLEILNEKTAEFFRILKKSLENFKGDFRSFKVAANHLIPESFNFFLAHQASPLLAKTSFQRGEIIESFFAYLVVCFGFLKKADQMKDSAGRSVFIDTQKMLSFVISLPQKFKESPETQHLFISFVLDLIHGEAVRGGSKESLLETMKMQAKVIGELIKNGVLNQNAFKFGFVSSLGNLWKLFNKLSYPSLSVCLLDLAERLVGFKDTNLNKEIVEALFQDLFTDSLKNLKFDENSQNYFQRLCDFGTKTTTLDALLMEKELNSIRTLLRMLSDIWERLNGAVNSFGTSSGSGFLVPSGGPAALRSQRDLFKSKENIETDIIDCFGILSDNEKLKEFEEKQRNEVLLECFRFIIVSTKRIIESFVLDEKSKFDASSSKTESLIRVLNRIKSLQVSDNEFFMERISKLFEMELSLVEKFKSKSHYAILLPHLNELILTKDLGVRQILKSIMDEFTKILMTNSHNPAS